MNVVVERCEEERQDIGLVSSEHLPVRGGKAVHGAGGGVAEGQERQPLGRVRHLLRLTRMSIRVRRFVRWVAGR